MANYLTGVPLLPVGLYRDRRSFGQAVRRARVAGRLVRYDRHRLGYWRRAELTSGSVLTYTHPTLEAR
jgi:hypothetical protein